MNVKTQNGVLTLFAEGRIDSANASAMEAEIAKLRAENAHETVVFDADRLEYISSAGLRVILRLRKDEPSLKIVNASSEVYEIFEMTGFTEMIPVSKAYRRLSVDGCEVIGTGANGVVYRLDSDTIIKVYRNPDCLDDVNRERELARRAFVEGIPTAIPYDVVRVGDSYGSVFELLSASSFAKLLAQDCGKIENCAQLTIELMNKIHAVSAPDLPSVKDYAMTWADIASTALPEEDGEKLVRLFREIPDDPMMIHGDFHIKNIMMQNGETLLIDMDTLCHGHPVFEFASMYNAYIGFHLANPSGVKDFLGVEEETAKAYWARCFELAFADETPEKRAEILTKIEAVGLTRLTRRILIRKINETEKGKAELKLYVEALLDRLHRIDTLTF